MSDKSVRAAVICPRCDQPRTIRIGLTEGYCLDCGLSWSLFADTDPSVQFTEQELARLRIYRAAVRAGFFNEAVEVAPARP
jgi:hypothetical protein